MEGYGAATINVLKAQKIPKILAKNNLELLEYITYFYLVKGKTQYFFTFFREDIKIIQALSN